MSTFHVVGFVLILCVLCMMFFLWLAENAPEVDEHEQPIAPQDLPRDLPISRTEFLQ